MFNETLHKINYGEVVKEPGNATLNANTREWIIFDETDRQYRKFIVDAFTTDIDTQYPQFKNKCAHGHENCPYVRMYRTRYEIYKKVDKLRREYIEKAQKLSTDPPRYRPLFRQKGPKPIRWIPKKDGSSTDQ